RSIRCPTETRSLCSRALIPSRVISPISRIAAAAPGSRSTRSFTLATRGPVAALMPVFPITKSTGGRTARWSNQRRPSPSIHQRRGVALLDRLLHVPESWLVERGAVREPFSVGPDEDLGSQVDRRAQGGLAEDHRVLPEEDQLPRGGGGHRRRFFALRLNPAALADFRTPRESGRHPTIERRVAGLRLDLLHRRVEVPLLDGHLFQGRLVQLRELQGILANREHRRFVADRGDLRARVLVRPLREV